MQRFTDLPKYSFNIYSVLNEGIWVKCPKCHGQGVVFSKPESNQQIYFQCQNCHHQQSRILSESSYTVHNFCTKCERHYRVEITDPKQQPHTVLKVACPFCGQVQDGKVKKATLAMYVLHRGRGYDPFFGFEFWFLTSFKGHPVWALNRRHLSYLIDFLGAELRERAPHSPFVTESDQLPRFFKLAKNREKLLKILQKLQHQDI